MSDHPFAVELCKRVERYPELYDISHEGFHNENAQRLAWKAIASELGAQPSKCKTKWKAIKHQFVKARKDCTTAWELRSSLKFLDEAANRKTSSLTDDALFIVTRSALESAKAGKPLQYLTASGRSSTGEADKGLEDMTWASAQNIRFFKQMQEKFARLSPEVVWTMKADILNMLDKAAKP
ncbi:hypothetical protein HPB51_003421 [Rhipicephalus microplus]|uniref:MADF domain-containing protein n=1 Tax=Rhipicephalus microplus TaxID=6941 RepID=A0A9J6DF41_RHIMP|nr:hypothetical protein HPB51_003421 [Rhipicephalus microplus]